MYKKRKSLICMYLLIDSCSFPKEIITQCVQRYMYEDIYLSLFIITKYWKQPIIKGWLLRNWLNKIS